MPTPLGLSNLPPPPPRLKPPPSPPKIATEVDEHGRGDDDLGREGRADGGPAHAGRRARHIGTQGPVRRRFYHKRLVALPLGDDDGVDDLAKKLERQATRAERRAASAQPRPTLSPVPVKRLLPHRGTLTPRDLESRESKRHVAALRLQTLLHHRRAEKAREDGAARAITAARAVSAVAAAVALIADTEKLIQKAEAESAEARRARVEAEASRDRALAAQQQAEDEAAALSERVAQLERAQAEAIKGPRPTKRRARRRSRPVYMPSRTRTRARRRRCGERDAARAMREGEKRSS